MRFENTGVRCLSVTASLCLATALPHMAHAQDVITLAPIIVTASGFEQSVANAPASVTVVTSEELQKGSFTSLSDALREVQGVTVTGVANEADIYIRGLPGQYTLILVDGKRQGTRDARTNGSSGYEQSFIPPIQAIDRIEVVRGPMSSLYGSDAMGGVINIITKPVADVWTGSATLETTLQDASGFKNSQQQSIYLSGPLMKDRLGLQIWGRKFDQNASTIENGPDGSDDIDLTGRLTWQVDPQNEIELEAGRTRIRSEELGDLSYRDHDRDHWSLSHKGTYGLTDTLLTFSQETGERTSQERVPGETTFREGLRSPKVTNSVLDARIGLPFTLAGEHRLSFGAQYFRAKVEDQNPGAQAAIPEDQRYDETFELDQWAVFVEDEWQIRNDFALTMGVRYNHHELYGSHVTPRLYGVWNATEALTLKGGISTGFKAPDIRTITPDYALTTGGGGCARNTPPSCGVILGNPDLDPEKTVNVELGAIYEGRGYNLGATVFRTEFKDKLQQIRTAETWTDGPRYTGADGNAYFYDIFRNFNVDEAVIKGVELTAGVEVTDRVRLRGSYTYTNSEQRTGDFRGFPLARTPEHMASLRADWQTPVTGLDAWVSANYHGSEIASGLRIGSNGSPITINGVEGRKYDAYTTVDLGGGYQINDTASFRAAIYNLFDKDIRETDFNTVVEGRRLWLGLTANF
ncbi:TonB-dependent receptor domain-containing protein [Falsirhodobacter halotolerans]|uniref:TonB-dependent receptor domain-containing protein n=1 Tax=Falsirhodobacter halotolerans TaxID=1146892 RepID=UPI001FD10613|nr:TonB-dependent receptor [Falsirhodobacter halotolerans]MCJ8139797.1 TonB-dependent receptor [Falsirhodobacter halotolerans]